MDIKGDIIFSLWASSIVGLLASIGISILESNITTGFEAGIIAILFSLALISGIFIGFIIASLIFKLEDNIRGRLA